MPAVLYSRNRPLRGRQLRQKGRLVGDAQGDGRWDTRGLLGRPGRRDQGRGQRSRGQDRDLGPRYEKLDALSELSRGDQLRSSHEREQHPDENALERDEAGLENEGAAHHAGEEPQGPKDADLSPALAHGPDHDHTEPRDPDHESKGEITLHELEELNENALEVLDEGSKRISLQTVGHELALQPPRHVGRARALLHPYVEAGRRGLAAERLTQRLVRHIHAGEREVVLDLGYHSAFDLFAGQGGDHRYRFADIDDAGGRAAPLLEESLRYDHRFRVGQKPVPNLVRRHPLLPLAQRRWAPVHECIVDARGRPGLWPRKARRLEQGGSE